MSPRTNRSSRCCIPDGDYVLNVFRLLAVETIMFRHAYLTKVNGDINAANIQFQTSGVLTSVLVRIR